jgi:opacity protein-like surface antigen
VKLKSIAAAAVLALVSLGASATAAAVVCADSTATTGNAGYISCQGPTLGNIAPGRTNTATFSGYGTFDLVGKSDDAGFGPFASNPAGATSGTLSFDTPQTGFFVLGIKGGPDYSLYLFDGGVAGISSLSFDTLGVFKGNGSAGPGLSHLALFAQPVPEPESYALMLAGLGVIGSIVRRRRRSV